MGENKIFHGPPGTGKTYLMQQLKNDYTDFNISDGEIFNAYINSSQEWILLTLIILQNNNIMLSNDIQKKIDNLNLPSTNDLELGASTILNMHSLNISSLFTPKEPQLFEQEDGKWYVHLDQLLLYDNTFFDTYLSKESIRERYKFVTFHQSFVYEDFVEGIKPALIDDSEDQDYSSGNKDISYKIESGVFKQICKQAKQNPHKRHAIFIDEINRGNITEIFGELITLIESDKRLGAANQIEVNLPYSKSKFGVPENLDIIGTMNTADRSIALIDNALMRRFNFIKMTCDLDLLEKGLKDINLNPHNIDGIDVLKLLEILNKRIELLLDSNFVVGHAYFMKVSSFDDIKDVMLYQIIPLLEEYFYDDLERIQLILNDLDEYGELRENAIYSHQELEITELFNYLGGYEYENKKSYYVSNNLDKNSFIKIYFD